MDKIYTWANGDIYEGDFQDDQRHGKGIFTCANGDKYEGAWLYDKRHGQGIFTCANGDKYEGEWLYDKRHGQGIYTCVNGNTYEGKWVNGKFSFTDGFILASNETLLSDNHTIVFPWGDKYEGDLKDGMPHGNGIYTGLDGKPQW